MAFWRCGIAYDFGRYIRSFRGSVFNRAYLCRYLHQVDVEPLLDKMGIAYDPAAKYLGRNGKFIGKPASAVVNCCPTDTIYDIKQ